MAKPKEPKKEETPKEIPHAPEPKGEDEAEHHKPLTKKVCAIEVLRHLRTFEKFIIGAYAGGFILTMAAYFSPNLALGICAGGAVVIGTVLVFNRRKINRLQLTYGVQ